MKCIKEKKPLEVISSSRSTLTTVRTRKLGRKLRITLLSCEVRDQESDHLDHEVAEDSCVELLVVLEVESNLLEYSL